ncbi:MAG: ThuA domain-containing protein [Gemmataceae bacterium]|nr:ThuA domain-containing protein [Gemmataceae bacterium]
MRWILVVVAVVLSWFNTSAVHAGGPKKLLLLSQGPDGHPPETHEYEAGLKILQKLLSKQPKLDVTIVKADEPWRDGPELLAKADGAVLFLSEGAKWLSNDPKRLAAFQDLAKRGGGLTCLHWAMGTRDAKNIAAFVDLFGACHGGPDRKYKVLETDVHFQPDTPIANGLKDFKVRDEFYYFLKTAKLGSRKQYLLPVLLADIDGNREMVAWGFTRPGDGRSFGFSGLHFHENWRMPEYRRLVAQGVLWTMNLPIPEKGVDVEVGK